MTQPDIPIPNHTRPAIGSTERAFGVDDFLQMSVGRAPTNWGEGNASRRLPTEAERPPMADAGTAVEDITHAHGQ